MRQHWSTKNFIQESLTHTRSPVFRSFIDLAICNQVLGKARGAFGRRGLWNSPKPCLARNASGLRQSQRAAIPFTQRSLAIFVIGSYVDRPLIFRRSLPPSV